jgi:hypothetical protein
MSQTQQPQTLPTYRASIIYIGKRTDIDPSNCFFVYAVSKEAAEKYTFDTMKKAGYKLDNFKVEVAPSSKEEIDFYVAKSSRADMSVS